jgi:hypothetical protein
MLYKISKSKADLAGWLKQFYVDFFLPQSTVAHAFVLPQKSEHYNK